MSPPPKAPKCALHGRSILLSASIPVPEAQQFRRIPEAAIRIEEAVLSVARAIFSEGGTLVLSGAPGISSLVARVLRHYYLPEPAEPTTQRSQRKDAQSHLSQEKPTRPDGTRDLFDGWRNPSLLICQSDAWMQFWMRDTDHLRQQPAVRVHWTRSVAGEVVNPFKSIELQAPQSMRAMRQEMINMTKPEAIVVIGGMEGVVQEVKLFRQESPRAPVYVLETTGGAAAQIAQEAQVRDETALRVADRSIVDEVRQFWNKQQRLQDVNETQGKFESERPGREAGGRQLEREYYVPYAFLAQRIIAEIVENDDSRGSAQ